MLSSFDTTGDKPGAWAGVSLVTRLALAWVSGVVLTPQGTSPWWLVGSALVAMLISLGLIKSPFQSAGKCTALVGLALLGGAWLVVQRDGAATTHVLRFIHDQPAITRVRGTIASIPRAVVSDQGAFGSFSFDGPSTLFELELDAVDAGRGFEPAVGSVLVSLIEHDHRPHLGQRIEATGRLGAIGSTQNPGEFDYRAYLREQGIVGRLTLERRGNWRALGPAPSWTLTGIRRQIGDAAASSLRLGMPKDGELLGLLDALLLGRRSGDIADLSDSFRAVGLSHVLSISGAHLGILLLMVWSLGRLFFGRPRVVAGLVLIVLALFLLAVPWRTPIVRAAIMAGVFCAGYGLGRRLTGVQLLSAATLIVLIWRPTDLFSAGFQLSFGVVGAILLFARPVSRWMLAEPEAQVVHPSLWDLGVRWCVDFAAVSVVAFAVALPLVMHHFLLVSPLAIVMSALALPVLTLVLGLGYLKIIVGLFSPAIGSLLGVPLAAAGDSLSGLVVQAQRWPGASFTLWSAPSAAWTFCASCLVLAVFGGLFHRRYAALMLGMLLVIGWGWAEQKPRSAMSGDDAPALTLNMFSVGDGSCYLVRSGNQSLMFDCGSQNYWRVGERSIVPALRALDVRRIDMLMISHADLDHYVGVLDVIDGVEVGRVLVSPDVMRDASLKPEGATAFLVAGLRERGFEPEPIERGWRAALGGAELEVLWPAEGFVSELNNNNALVLRVDVANRAVLLNGDIQGDAIDQLLQGRAGLKADVTDLPHHGSFIKQSPDWLSAVSPVLVLQSAGPRRPEQDRWAPLLERPGVTRLRTSERGMVELQIEHDGAIEWSAHRQAK